MLTILSILLFGLPESAFIALGKVAGAASAVVAIGGVINRFGIRPVKQFWIEWQAQRKMMLQLQERMDLISNEFLPNNGTTLRDAVDKLTKQLFFLDQQTKMMLGNQMDHGVFITNEKGDIMWANALFLKITGRTLEEIQGKGWKTAVSLNHRNKVVEEWKSCIEDDRGFEMDFLFETPDKQEIHVHCTTTKVIGKDSKAIGFIGIVNKLDLIRRPKLLPPS